MTPDTSNEALDALEAALCDCALRWAGNGPSGLIVSARDAITALRAQLAEARMQIISDGCQLQEAHAAPPLSAALTAQDAAKVLLAELDAAPEPEAVARWARAFEAMGAEPGLGWAKFRAALRAIGGET